MWLGWSPRPATRKPRWAQASSPRGSRLAWQTPASPSAVVRHPWPPHRVLHAPREVRGHDAPEPCHLPPDAPEARPVLANELFVRRHAPHEAPAAEAHLLQLAGSVEAQPAAYSAHAAPKTPPT
eukprot:11207657-Lingulodinium_polyedra.AAC.2